MRALITIFFFCLVSSFCEAQMREDSSGTSLKIKNKINELKIDKVDTIIAYYVNCIGSMRPWFRDSCLGSDTRYLLWAKNGKYCIQKFDECDEHKISDLNGGVFGLLKKNYPEIKKQDLRYPEFTIIEKGKAKTYYSVIDHSCHYIIEIYISNNVLKKDIDDFALDTKYVEEKYKNKNYSVNQKSVLNKLKMIVEQNVSAYNKKVLDIKEFLQISGSENKKGTQIERL